jgi:hypothetical protein
MTKLTLRLSLLLLAVLVSSLPTKADQMGTLVLTNCGTKAGCPGASYFFDVTSTFATLKITINDGLNPGVNNEIGSVDLGFSPSGTISGLSLSAAPSTLSDWTSTSGSLNSGSSGCGTNSGAFVCATALPSNPLPITQGGTYTWTWTYSPIDASSIDSAVHIGVQYGPNSAGNWKGLQVSQDSTASASPVPEPASMVLLGAGLLALGGFSKRFKKS